MDATVFNVIKQVMDGKFEGGILLGSLENGGVDLAPFHEMESAVPAELKQELETIRAGIIDGSITVSPK